ncbi:hypothetical protein [Heyndrickxia sporothermodurans]|uniref:LPXTG cell wall anchor domain-containing protein n=2 Tax=Heyndrickxia sporothermodurans TaxID=46224 RepID=A0AB37HCE1_9BACI|nr:hypothetical protein JGZ69_00175 [Heyndrickxia sporothermodurans]
MITNAQEPQRAKCHMTIVADKHNEDHPATASAECKKLIFGYYAKNVNTFNITGMAEQEVKHNGQKFIISVFSNKYAEAELTVYTKQHEVGKIKTNADTSSDEPNTTKIFLCIFLLIGILGGFVWYRKRRYNEKK